jgi:hypothetical protein
VNICRDCIHWRDLNDSWAGKGECRRYPPSPSAADKRYGDHAWPQTVRDSWCGEFFPREGKSA